VRPVRVAIRSVAQGSRERKLSTAFRSRALYTIRNLSTDFSVLGAFEIVNNEVQSI